MGFRNALVDFYHEYIVTPDYSEERLVNWGRYPSVYIPEPKRGNSLLQSEQHYLAAGLRFAL